MASETRALEAFTIIVQVISGLAIAANVLVMVVFAATRKLRLRYYVFVINLTLADTVAPVAAIVYQNLPVAVAVAIVRAAFFAAELSILAVAVTRLLALTVTPASRYDATVTRGRMVAACLLIWVASVAIYIPATVFQAHAMFLFRPLLVIAVLLVTGVLYFVVFRKIVAFRAPLASTPGASESDQRAGKRLAQIHHLMVSFTIILVVSILAWLPLCIANVSVYISGKSVLDQTVWFRAVYMATVACLLVRSVVNPFVYWWRLDDFRQTLASCLLPGQRRSRPENDNAAPVTMNTEIPMN